MSTFFSIDDNDDETIFSESEKQEIEAKRQAIQDVFGTTSAIKRFRDADEARLSIARAQLKDAVALLDGDLKVTYETAAKRAPDLVEKESSPDRFIFAHDFDPWAAARNIALYWKARIDIFGNEKAFLPMDLSGKGALSPEVIQGMKCGGLALLPTDRYGRRIVLCNRSRMCSQCFQGHVRIQICFWLCHTVFSEENDLGIDNGFIVLAAVNAAWSKKKTEEEKTEDTKSGLAGKTPAINVMRFLVSGAIPIHLKAFHLVNFREKSFMEYFLPQWLNIFERLQFISPRSVVHFPPSPQAARDNFEQYGFLPEHIPQELGGKLDYDTWFDQWFGLVQAGTGASEASLLALGNSKPRSAARHTAFPENPPKCSAAQGGGTGNAVPSVAEAKAGGTNDAARSRKRKLDCIYQRKKREREKQFLASLTKQVNALREDNSTLKSRHGFLAMLWECAQKIVQDTVSLEEQHAPESSNIFYSSRRTTTATIATTERPQPPQQREQQTTLSSNLLDRLLIDNVADNIHLPQYTPTAPLSLDSNSLAAILQMQQQPSLQGFEAAPANYDAATTDNIGSTLFRLWNSLSGSSLAPTAQHNLQQQQLQTTIQQSQFPSSQQQVGQISAQDLSTLLGLGGPAASNLLGVPLQQPSLALFQQQQQQQQQLLAAQEQSQNELLEVLLQNNRRPA